MRLDAEAEVWRVAAVSDPALLTDEEVVSRILAGDTGAFEVIIRRYNQRLYRAARGVLRNETEAEDVVQEAYLQSLRHLKSFRWQSSLATWLTRIAVNEACARRRRRARAENPGPGQERHEPSAETSLRRLEAGHALHEHIDGLPSSLRTVLVLRVVEGLDTRETAECLGISEASVKVRLHRALAALKKKMALSLVEELQTVYAFDGERCDRIVRSVMSRARAEA